MDNECSMHDKRTMVDGLQFVKKICVRIYPHEFAVLLFCPCLATCCPVVAVSLLRHLRFIESFNSSATVGHFAL